MVLYDKKYYIANRQTEDRIAFSFYYRLACSYVKRGKVLDFGCGTGHLIKRFQKGYEAWAYDTSSYALEEVQRVAPQVHICSSLDCVQKRQYNLVLSLHVIEHVADPLQQLMELRKLLEPQGILLYAVPNLSGLGHRLKNDRWPCLHDPTHISLHPAKQWEQWTEQAGLEIVHAGTDGLWDVPYLPYIPAILQKLLFYPLPALQVATGRLFLPSMFGEALIVIARKKECVL